MSNNQIQFPLTEAVYYILLALHAPMHGYGIMQFVKEMSNERVTLGPGTLYGALKTLQDKGWIELVQSDNDRKKEYQITEVGKQIIEGELIRLEELLRSGKKVVGGVNKNEN